MKKISPMLLAFRVAALTCDATSLLPPITEAEACTWADLVGEVKVLAIAPLVENGVTQKSASVISIEILTKGVSAKTKATVLWNQTLADATLIRKGPPGVGREYRAYLHVRRGENKWDFEPVHPDWGFVESNDTDGHAQPSFVEHTVQRGDTLWGIAQHYYGTGTRWRVLRAANFTNDAPLEAYPLKSGMRLRIPSFPMRMSTQPGKGD
jgi:hypothetical protein